MFIQCLGNSGRDSMLSLPPVGEFSRRNLEYQLTGGNKISYKVSVS